MTRRERRTKIRSKPRPASSALVDSRTRDRMRTGTQLPDAKVGQLALDLGRMIEAARQQVARTANAALTTLYWQLGKRVHTEVLASRRAEYGARIVAALGRQLEKRYGRGFGEKNLRRMVQFAEAFPDEEHHTARSGLTSPGPMSSRARACSTGARLLSRFAGDKLSA